MRAFRVRKSALLAAVLRLVSKFYLTKWKKKPALLCFVYVVITIDQIVLREIPTPASLLYGAITFATTSVTGFSLLR